MAYTINPEWDSVNRPPDVAINGLLHVQPSAGGAIGAAPVMTVGAASSGSSGTVTVPFSIDYLDPYEGIVFRLNLSAPPYTFPSYTFPSYTFPAYCNSADGTPMTSLPSITLSFTENSTPCGSLSSTGIGGGSGGGGV